MSARLRPVILESHPEFVPDRRIQREKVQSAAFARIHVRAADISVQVVHVQPGLAEGELGRRAQILDHRVQAERNDHAAAARLPEAQHAFAVA